MQLINETGCIFIAISFTIKIFELHTAVMCKLKRRVQLLMRFTPDNADSIEIKIFPGGSGGIDVV